MENDIITTTTATFVGDQSLKCRIASYQLHIWLLAQSTSPLMSSVDPVRVTCKGAGFLEFSESDADSVQSDTLTVDIAGTRKCREFFYRYLEQLLQS